MILAGTFGELRTAHFHSGIDLKTQQKEGLKVHAAAPGYVSRIKVSNWGYGKALYVTHPNGYTTVYAHLKKFNAKIEAYLKEKQYALEKDEIQLFPKKENLTIEKDEVIAFSGSTGGFIAPHLHFEIRNTKTEKIINPMHFGLIPADSKPPVINHLRAFVLNDSSHVNTSAIDLPIAIKQTQRAVYQAELVTALGKIGFGINTYDRQDGALNKNGIYQLELFINGKRTFSHHVETFSFDESKYINLLIDYPFYATHKRKYQKTFIHEKSTLSTYNRQLTDGSITVKDGDAYQVEIRVTDFVGNQAKLYIPVLGEKVNSKIKKAPAKTNYFVNPEADTTFEKEYISVHFPKHSVYDPFYLDLKITDSIVTVHTPTVPLHKSYTLSFDVKHYTKAQKEKLFIAQVTDGKNYNYVGTVKNDSLFKTSTKSLGDFTLVADNLPPKIFNCSFYEGQNLSNYHYLTIQTEDKGSGIKSYRGEIDGKWILLEMNVKTNTLTYDFKDGELSKGKHIFTLISMDNVGNTCTFTSSFVIK